MKAFDRVKLLIGCDKYKLLTNASVAIFGIGGVGGYTAEALARSGVGKLTIIDSDTVSESNINRQIIADYNTISKDKVAVMKERLLLINPNMQVDCHKIFYLPENAGSFDFSHFDYVVDAVDTVSAKLEIILRAKKEKVNVISCMGTGGKIDPTLLKVTDINKTNGCPLARVMRRELKKRGVDKLKVVFSEETVKKCDEDNTLNESKGKNGVAPPSMIFVPASAGLLLAREVVFDLIKDKGDRKDT